MLNCSSMTSTRAACICRVECNYPRCNYGQCIRRGMLGKHRPPGTPVKALELICNNDAKHTKSPRSGICVGGIRRSPAQRPLLCLKTNGDCRLSRPRGASRLRRTGIAGLMPRLAAVQSHEQFSVVAASVCWILMLGGAYSQGKFDKKSIGSAAKNSSYAYRL
jgi:hypothetical protein